MKPFDQIRRRVAPTKRVSVSCRVRSALAGQHTVAPDDVSLPFVGRGDSRHIVGRRLHSR